jgi:hypothetical protein
MVMGTFGKMVFILGLYPVFGFCGVAGEDVARLFAVRTETMSLLFSFFFF